MPIYGYACESCGHMLDALQKVSDEPLVDCPECGGSALKRQLSAPRFRLKGKGWYETDFKSDNQRNLAGEKADASDKAAATVDSDSKDDKSDAKAKQKPSEKKRETSAKKTKSDHD